MLLSLKEIDFHADFFLNFSLRLCLTPCMHHLLGSVGWNFKTVLGESPRSWKSSSFSLLSVMTPRRKQNLRFPYLSSLLFLLKRLVSGIFPLLLEDQYAQAYANSSSTCSDFSSPVPSATTVCHQSTDDRHGLMADSADSPADSADSPADGGNLLGAPGASVQPVIASKPAIVSKS